MERPEVAQIVREELARHPLGIAARALANRLLYGYGAPGVAAPVGTIWLRLDGGASSTLYIKESGTGTAGWVAK